MITWEEMARNYPQQLRENECRFNEDGDLVAIGRLREALRIVCEAADCRAGNWQDPDDNAELYEESERVRLEISERITDAIKDVERLLRHSYE